MDSKLKYVECRRTDTIPRLPLEGSFDPTYRCNNNCRHCWLRIPPRSLEKQRELTTDEIETIVDEARKMGCCTWAISGGEPMLRPDFTEIFNYVTGKAVSYSLNTNGTLITPQIAQLMRRKGNKMVVLYGATEEVHDRITRNPGSFEATMQGFAYLKEAGAGFTIQLIPMKDNYHQFSDMVSLAESLSRNWRIGAAWLYLSADGDLHRNREIMRQRLNPREVIDLDKPNLLYEESKESTKDHRYSHPKEDDRLFASCIALRRGFHIDPYGQMTFCDFIKDPALRYDLRKGSFKECWEEFIPSLVDKVRGRTEYWENCGSCELRSDCRWCPVYSYLEHRRFSARVDYLCDVAKENRKFKEHWQRNHRRYYQIGGITIQVDSDLPITSFTFQPKFRLFETNGPGEDTITVSHHFSLPDLSDKHLGEEVYRRPPWAIYRNGNSWIYMGIFHWAGGDDIRRLAVFNHDHTHAKIYNNGEETFRTGGLHSLTLFPTDMVLLAPLLADRQGCYFHSSGVDFRGNGLLFVGHSGAGKSTMVRMLKDEAQILCDEGTIVRRQHDGFRIYGTWSHGEVSEVSADSAPLKAIFFLKQAQENRIIPLGDRGEATRKLLACLIKPFPTADWWDKILCLIDRIVHEVPCYYLHFDKSGEVKELLKRFLESGECEVTLTPLD